MFSYLIKNLRFKILYSNFFQFFKYFFLEHLGQEGRKSCCLQPYGLLTLLYRYQPVRLVRQHGAYYEGSGSQGYLHHGVSKKKLDVKYI